MMIRSLRAVNIGILRRKTHTFLKEQSWIHRRFAVSRNSAVRDLLLAHHRKRSHRSSRLHPTRDSKRQPSDKHQKKCHPRSLHSRGPGFTGWLVHSKLAPQGWIEHVFGSPTSITDEEGPTA